MNKEIKLGCPMEYEVDNIIYNGLFLREDEVNIVFKELEKLNKQKEVLDKIKEYINRTEINSVGKPLAYTEIGKELLEILEEIE